MQFRDTWQMVLDGTKTQTRRIAKPDDRIFVEFDDYIVAAPWESPILLAGIHMTYKITGIMRSGRWLWKVDQRYSIQPGRGRHGIGSFKVPMIRCQHLQDITEDDARAEGAHAIEWTETVEQQVSDTEFVPMPVTLASYRYGFQELWTGLWQGTPYDWDQNPIVYPLGIAEVKRNE